MNPLATPSVAKRNRLALVDCFHSALSSHCMRCFHKADSHLSFLNGFRGTVVFVWSVWMCQHECDSLKQTDPNSLNRIHSRGKMFYLRFVWNYFEVCHYFWKTMGSFSQLLFLPWDVFKRTNSYIICCLKNMVFWKWRKILWFWNSRVPLCSRTFHILKWLHETPPSFSIFPESLTSRP